MAGTISLKTPRLSLRRHVAEDAGLLYQNFGTDAAMFRYSGWNPYVTPEQARGTVQRFIDSYADPRFYGWAIEREGRMIGTIGAYDYDPKKNQIEVGFSIERASWGKGYAAEALRAVLEYLTVQEGIARVTAWCVSDNIASKRILEKAGMRLAGIDAGGLEVEGQRYDRLDYAYDRIQ
ncbi:MAG: GNAT family N-acetyltransferase [Oscillospiraceae bacterium]|nr:GNAT family N-acetyltransferase [Oscillospiraceae bacterium]